MTDAGRGMSLERRLPLLMSAVLAVVLATSLVLTYRTLATTARATASVRLREVARLLAASAEQNTRARAVALLRAARDTSVVRALRGAADAPTAPRPAELSAAQAVLQKLSLPTDSGLPIMLWTADGRRVTSVGVDVAPVLRPELPNATPPASGPADSMITGAPYLSGGRVYYQQLVPVDDGRRRLGYLLLLRRLANNPAVVTQLRQLTGEDAALYLHQTASTTWASIAGVPVSAPTPVSADLVTRDGSDERLTASAPVRGTPWIVTVEEPLAAVLARPRTVLGSLATLSVLLGLAGAAASWLIGRRITRPLGQLTAAAEAMARGDYRSRVPERGGAEVGRLARSFNAMAAEVDTSQRELENQFAEASAVAAELEQTNRQLQDAMRESAEARDAAESANRAKSDFLAVMSHELRTPLNAIGGYTELLQVGIYGPLTEEQTQALGRITRSQQHLLGLINDVLNFARLSAAKVEFELCDVPVREALTNVETMIRPQLDAKSLHYRCELDDEDLAVRADQEKLQQILLNLLSNAVKFTPEGGSVTVRGRADDEGVHLAVHDTGVGIAADRLAHVFEPFVQVTRALNRPSEGVGLGLAISQDLAVGMGGTLRVASTLGEGSTFTLVLPRANAQSVERVVESAEAR